MSPIPTCNGAGCTTRLYGHTTKYRDHPSSNYICKACYNKKKSLVSTPKEAASTTRHDLQPLNLQQPRPIRQVPSNQPTIVPSPPVIHSQPMVPPLMLRTIPHCESICSICQNPTGRNHINKIARIQAWKELELFIPINNRICLSHIDVLTQLLDAPSLAALNARSKIDVVPQECVMSLLALLTEELSKPSTAPPRIQFENDLYTDQNCKNLNFKDLANYCKTHLASVRVTGYHTCVGVFLTWLRLGISQDALSAFFGLTQRSVSRIIYRVIETLTEVFVPLNLGYDHISRQDFLQKHTTQLSLKLCDGLPNSAPFVLDTTYLFIQKSANYELQMKTYSLHKHRNLTKAMFIVSTAGYILEVEGLYFTDGGNNDASILTSMLTNPSGFQNFFEEGDICVLDRGFRDSVSFAESIGLVVKTPKYLQRRQKQFSPQDANSSRSVTMTRWVVEAVNARIKCFHFFQNVIPNTYLPVLGDVLRIACALENKYSPPLTADKPEHAGIIQSVLARLQSGNALQDEIILNRMDRQIIAWRPLDGIDLEDFPILSIDDLQQLTLGVYQIRLAPSYTAHHMREAEYTLFYHRDNMQILRVKMESRHTKKSYQLWIKYKPNDHSPTSILGWYCQCKVGARVVGMCAHCTSVLWFLGHARHEETIHQPAHNLGDNILDASTLTYDSD